MTAVSAVIPAWNRKELLLECIAALGAQTHPVSRVVVVDNASTDGTEAALREAGLLDGDWLVYRRMERNLGSAGGYAAAVETARELEVDWIWLLDDDAEPRPDALERLIAAPEASAPDTAALATAVVVPDGEIDVLHRGHIGRFMHALPIEEYRDGNHVELDFASYTGLMVSGRAARAEDPPRSDFFTWADDVEYCIRIRRHGRIRLVPESVVVHKARMGGERVTRRGRLAGRVLGAEYPSTEWPSYFKAVHAIRNYAWIRRHHFGASGADLAVIAAAYVGKSLIYDDRPLRRIPWILWAVREARRDEPVDLSPDRWRELTREGRAARPRDLRT